MQGWNWKLWAFGAFISIWYISNIVFAGYLFVQADRGLLFVLINLSWVPLIVVSIYLRKTHKFHFHHYTAAMLAIPILGIPHGLIALYSGWSSGVMVEGAARWGYDTHWNPIK